MNKRFSLGFTLIEILVVSGIFVVITTTVVTILIIIFRGTKKSDSMVVVKQNGEQAMAQMVRIMRFAENLDYPSSCNGTPRDHITITAVDLSQKSFTCPANFNFPNFIGLNGTKLTNSATVIVQSCSFVCRQSAGGPPTISISFALRKVNSNGLPEGDARIPFSSSVTLRNLVAQ